MGKEKPNTWTINGGNKYKHGELEEEGTNTGGDYYVGPFAFVSLFMWILAGQRKGEVDINSHKQTRENGSGGQGPLKPVNNLHLVSNDNEAQTKTTGSTDSERTGKSLSYCCCFFYFIFFGSFVVHAVQLHARLAVIKSSAPL